MTAILGINAYHPDSSACLLIDGEIVASVEEERLRRVKHWGGFPSKSIEYCLESSSIEWSDLTCIAVNSNALRSILHRLSIKSVTELRPFKLARQFQSLRSKLSIERDLLSHFGTQAAKIRRYHFDHHDCHLASAYCLSPFDRSLLMSVDGFGDGQSAAWGVGGPEGIEVIGRVRFPHSLGVFYQAVTQFLGFWNYGDEYKVMGLAPYADEFDTEMFDDVIRITERPGFELNLSYFTHHREGVKVELCEGRFNYGPLFSDKFVKQFGPPMTNAGKVDKRAMNIAWAAQNKYEEALFKMADFFTSDLLAKGEHNLGLAGGCAMNSVANGKLARSGLFENVHVQSAPGDPGGALGATFLAHRRILGAFPDKSKSPNRSPYLGPSFSGADILRELKSVEHLLTKDGVKTNAYDNFDNLCTDVAQIISEGKVVGWFQGRAEFGPRALGNRSILADPRNSDIRELLNAKIKLRESFRPFAPSVIEEMVAEWFDSVESEPYMSKVGVVKKAVREKIPAVTHVDGTGRLQTVSATDNPLFYKLLQKFSALTAVPILLNTSFNENEPMVTAPKEALECFLRTKMDALVIDNYLLKRC